MSRKHNTQHPERGRSRYPRRLRDRGLSRTPMMSPFRTASERIALRVRTGMSARDAQRMETGR